jgi:3-hydroxymyristoyl/3-hydroxydecanoyl-(acyl carrier protein) dehydratase
LSGSWFFAPIGERALLGDLRQVRDYLHKPEVRREARQRLAKAVEEDTWVLVGHSLARVPMCGVLVLELIRALELIICCCSEQSRPEAERRVGICGQQNGICRHPVLPSEEADDEIEQGMRIATSEQNGEP